MRRILTWGLLMSLSAMLAGCASLPQNAPPQEEAPAAQARSIVATSPAICEILDALGYDRVIGVPQTQRALPERYAGASAVGAPMNPDLEIIKSLSPDLVLSPQSLEPALAEGYRAAGLTSAFLDLSSVEGMYDAIVSLGAYLGCEAAAAALKEDHAAYLAAYRAQTQPAQEILLLMAFPDGFYLVATEKSYVGSLVETAGARNVYRDYQSDGEGFARISPEDIAGKAPDQIFVFAHYAEEEAFAFMEREFAQNEVWQHFEAVRAGRIVFLPGAYFGMSADLHWRDALAYLAPCLRGETS